MGKQSRKKQGKADKQSHRAKVQERRQRATQPVAVTARRRRHRHGGDGYVDEFTILEDDVVWFDLTTDKESSIALNKDPHRYRGIVRSMDDAGGARTTFHVTPFAELLHGNPHITCSVVPDKGHFVCRDRDCLQFWALRYGVGQTVVCHTDDDGSWLRGEITQLWPIAYRTGIIVPAYEIHGLDSSFHVCAPLDEDRFVMVRSRRTNEPKVHRVVVSHSLYGIQ